MIGRFFFDVEAGPKLLHTFTIAGVVSCATNNDFGNLVANMCVVIGFEPFHDRSISSVCSLFSDETGIA